LGGFRDSESRVASRDIASERLHRCA
jgi:hypothetical protein